MGSCGLANAAPKHAPETLSAATGAGKLATVVAGGLERMINPKVKKWRALKDNRIWPYGVALELKMNPSKDTGTSKLSQFA